MNSAQPAPAIDFKAIASLEGCARRTGVPVFADAVLKGTPEDFVVEEVPSYLPNGSGEHLFLWIQKRDLTTDQLRHHLARTLGISGRDIGTAGNKDRRAVTRQFVSIPASCAGRLDLVRTPAIQVLDSKLHHNKLRTGHLRANRFDVFLRTNITPEIQQACEQKLQQLAQAGFVNYYGPQRFGGGDTPRLGWELLTGRRTRRAMTKEFGRSMFRLSLSSLQSAAFNAVAARRANDRTIDRVQCGDVVAFRDRRTHFRVVDPTAEQQRIDHHELVITGPIFGRKMTSTDGAIAQLEAAVLSSFGLPDDAFTRYPKLTVGTRRPLVRWPDELMWQFGVGGVRLQFSLPSGTYATVFLRELAERLAVPASSAGAAESGGDVLAKSAEG